MIPKEKDALIHEHELHLMELQRLLNEKNQLIIIAHKQINELLDRQSSEHAIEISPYA